MQYKSLEEEEGKRRCLECGDSIMFGRADRKFCSESCKNSFHNREWRDSKNIKRRVWHVLENNHRILSAAIKSGRDSIDLAELSALGVDINYMTSYHKVGCHNEYRCFDVVYCLSSSRIFRLRRMGREEEQS